MDSSEAINQAEIAANPEQDDSIRMRDYVAPVVNRMRRRPLFQKVIIANTALIAAVMITGIYLGRKQLAGTGPDFLALSMLSGILLSIFVNYLLVRVAFNPLQDITGKITAVLAGHRDISAPRVNDNAEMKELSRSLSTIIDNLEQQRRQGASTAIMAQEEERKRIARELHDETSQSLTGLLICIGMAQELVPDSLPELKERLNNIRAIARTTLEEVHTMATRLRPSVLDDLGLSSALSSFVKDFTENTGIDVDLRLLSMYRRLSPELETVLYRVVQEALTNVARHSGADSCEVRIEHRGLAVHGVIADNGKGFDPNSVMSRSRGRSLGLKGMKERIKLVQGSIEVDSRPREGTTIRLNVPLGPREGFR